MKREKIIAIITGPSAVGKTTIAKALLKKLKNFKPAVTYTTRQKRDWQTEDKIMNYTDVKGFRQMIDNDEFIEWAQVYDNFYGTHKPSIDKILEKHNVLLNIDVQGTKIIKKKNPRSITIFVLPESIDDIKQRLAERPMLDEIKKKRLVKAEEEIAQATDFDYQIVNYNGKVEQTIEKITNILKHY